MTVVLKYKTCTLIRSMKQHQPFFARCTELHRDRYRESTRARSSTLHRDRDRETTLAGKRDTERETERDGEGQKREVHRQGSLQEIRRHGVNSEEG
jgi:hypothetical protein